MCVLRKRVVASEVFEILIAASAYTRKLTASQSVSSEPNTPSQSLNRISMCSHKIRLLLSSYRETVPFWVEFAEERAVVITQRYSFQPVAGTFLHNGPAFSSAAHGCRFR